MLICISIIKRYLYNTNNNVFIPSRIINENLILDELRKLLKVTMITKQSLHWSIPPWTFVKNVALDLYQKKKKNL